MNYNETVVHAFSVDLDGDPKKGVIALVKVCKMLCEENGKSPMEGVLMLMTAAAFILDGMAENIPHDDNLRDVFRHIADKGFDGFELFFGGQDENTTVQ
jgi:hypothetical protein